MQSSSNLNRSGRLTRGALRHQPTSKCPSKPWFEVVESLIFLTLKPVLLRTLSDFSKRNPMTTRRVATTSIGRATYPLPPCKKMGRATLRILVKLLHR